MRNFMKRSALIKVLLALMIFVGLHQYCMVQIGDFEISQVLSDRENSPEWDTEDQDVTGLLSQTFTFLGMGDQAYAFLGEDKKTVLKLFKHYDAQGKRPLDHIFTSCKLAYEELREETGLIYLHINKSPSCHVTLIDKLGFAHTIDINATEYALQKKADDLIFPTLEGKLRHKDYDAAKKAIQKLFVLIAQRCDKGIGDRDTALRRNYGYKGLEPIALDIGSYFKDDALKDPAPRHEEIAHKTRRLFRWLKKHDPDLLPFYEAELAKY